MTTEQIILRDTSKAHNSALYKYKIIPEETYLKHKAMLSGEDVEMIRLAIKIIEEVYKKSKKRMYGKARLQRVRTTSGKLG